MAFTFFVPGIVAIGSGIAAGIAAIGTTVAGLVGVTATGTLATAIGAGTISATMTAIQGGGVEDILKSAVIGGTTSYFGGTIASEIAGSVAMSGATIAADLGFADLASSLFSTSEQIIKGALTSSFGAVLTGDDPVDALIKGGLSAGVSEVVGATIDSVVGDIPEIDKLRQSYGGSALERALRTSVAATVVSGADFDESFVSSLKATGAKALFDEVNKSFKDLAPKLTTDEALLQQSEEQVSGLIRRERDVKTQITSFLSEYEEAEEDINALLKQEKGYIDTINNVYVPEGQRLQEEANRINSVVTMLQAENGPQHWYYQKNPGMFWYDRAGSTYGDFTISNHLPMGRSSYHIVTYTPTGETFKATSGEQAVAAINWMINKTNSAAEALNNRAETLQTNVDVAKAGIATVKSEFDKIYPTVQSAQSRLDGLMGDLETIRDEFDAIKPTLDARQDTYKNTLKEFIQSESNNAAVVADVLENLPQVISSYEADYGVKPTDQQLADLFTSGNGDITKGYVSFDVNNVSEKEAEAFLGELGYIPTEDEIKQFVGQVNEDATKANIAGYVDLVNTDYAEAESFLKGLGYTPTEDEIKQFVGKVNEDAARANIAAYVNPRQVTEAEAREFLEANGYTPTEDEIKQFIGQITEDATKANIAGYVDPRQVTEAEAREFLEANGYTPTEDEIKRFVGQVNEDTARANIASYVNPRQVTEAEAIQVLTDLGVDPESEYGKDLIAEYTRQGNQDTLIQQLNNEILSNRETNTDTVVGGLGADTTTGGSGTDTGGTDTGGVDSTQDDGLGDLTDEETNIITDLLQNIPVPPGTKTPSFDELISNPEYDSVVDAWFAAARTSPELAKQAFLDPNSGWQAALEDLGMSEKDFLALANEGINPTEFVNQLADYINERRDVLRGVDTDTVVGGSGTDTTTGSSGTDTVVGGSDTDTTTGSSGTDTVVGGSDTDTGGVDTNQLTEAEARQVLTDLGVDPESEYGKDLIAEYTRQGDETQLIDQLTAGADSFIRTPKTVGDLLKLATNPVAYVLSPVSGEISKLVTGAITNAVGADNLDTQTKALIKTASAAVVNGAFAALLGGDFKKAALGTVVGTALNALPIPGTKDLFEGANKDLTFNQIVDRISTSALSAAGLDVDSKFGTRIVDGTNSAIRAGLIAAVAGGNEKQILINTGTAFLGGAFGNTTLSKDVSKKLDTFGDELTEDAFDENGILKGLDPVDRIVVQGKSDTDTGIEEATGIIGGLALMKRFTKDDVAPVSGGSGQDTVSGGGGGSSVTITATRESCAAEGKGFNETTNQCVDPVDVIGGGSGQGTVGGGQDTVGGGQDTVGGGSVEVTSCGPGKTRDPETGLCLETVEEDEECPPGQVDTGFGCQDITAGPVSGGGGDGSITVTGCGPGKTRDPETGLCLETVEEDEECPPGQVDTGFGCQDITAGPCDPGFHDENGLCVADTDKNPPECPAGQVRNLNTGLCEAVQPDPCPAGYKRNAAGECEIQVQYQPLPSFFGIDNLLRNRGGGAGYSPNLREKFTAVRTYTPPPEDYDYFKDDYFQRFGPISYVPPENYAGAGKAEGGLMSLAKGGRTSLPPRYLDGHSDGMADQVPASIDNSRPAALSDGEFVIPADVVSHLGNGNSNAGAKVLYEMMDRIRRARTGNSKQGKQINPSKFIPR